MVTWDHVTRAEVLRAIQEYDRLGPDAFFATHGFAWTTTYELLWEERRYPPKAILGTAYEFATGQRLASGDFEGGRAARSRCSGTWVSPSRKSSGASPASRRNPPDSPHLPHRHHWPLPSAGGTAVVCPYPRLSGAVCPSPRYPAGMTAATIYGDPWREQWYAGD